MNQVKWGDFLQLPFRKNTANTQSLFNMSHNVFRQVDRKNKVENRPKINLGHTPLPADNDVYFFPIRSDLFQSSGSLQPRPLIARSTTANHHKWEKPEKNEEESTLSRRRIINPSRASAWWFTMALQLSGILL